MMTGMEPTSAGEPPNHVSGCLFLLLWVSIVLGLVALGLFVWFAHVAQSVGD